MVIGATRRTQTPSAIGTVLPMAIKTSLQLMLRSTAASMEDPNWRLEFVLDFRLAPLATLLVLNMPGVSRVTQ